MNRTKQIVASALIIAGAITGCTSKQTSYNVTGTLPDESQEGQYLYLYSYEGKENIDSVLVTGQTFAFSGGAGEPELVRIDFDRMHYANFILEAGDITVDFTTHLPSPTTPLNKEWVDYQTAVDENMQKARERYNEIESIQDPEEKAKRQKEFQQEFGGPNGSHGALLKKIFEKNKNNLVGGRALLDYSYDTEPEDVEKLLAEAGSEILSMPSIQDLMKRNEVLKKTVEGMDFTDFTVEDSDGKEVSLSDYVGKGKYVLVDFWASWCGPCIQETPVLAEVYEKYKDKGFEVLGVAVWDDPKDTKEAIKKHNITWPQIINARNAAQDFYGVSGIPHIILFSPDGKIVKRNLRGDALKKAVKEAME